MNIMHTESYFIPVTRADKLHLKRMFQNPSGVPIFLLHGAVENGRIFYSSSGKGLGPYLASQGFDVYIGELRGRGLSTPSISRKSHYGQTEAITGDIPAFIEQIIKIRGDCPQHWIAHSWGGVLLSSYLSRFEKHRHLVKSMVYVASKRRIKVFNLHRLYTVDFGWCFLAPIIAGFAGYLPAKKIGMGSDDETRNSLAQSIRWVTEENWIDDDGFDYKQAIAQASLPPILYLAGARDYCLGNPKDVRDFMLESRADNAAFRVLSKANGNLHDYDHINILTHVDAQRDHFPMIVEWLNR